MKVGYATLYDDGELVISKNHTLLKRKIIKDYGEFEDTNVPWKKEVSKIKKVQILDQVKPNCMNAWFEYCLNLKTLIDFEHLDVSNSTDFSSMFYNCTSLQNINGLENWNVSNGIYFSSMFKSCTSLQDIKALKDWNVSNGTDFPSMFYNCESLQDLNRLQNWDVSNGTDFSYMFYHCESLQNINGLENWNVSNGIYFPNMFAFCKSLQEIYITNTLDILTKEMFYDCNSNLKIHWKKHDYTYADLIEYGKIC